MVWECGVGVWECGVKVLESGSECVEGWELWGSPGRERNLRSIFFHKCPRAFMKNIYAQFEVIYFFYKCPRAFIKK